MRWIPFALMCLTVPAFGRLGETLDQAEARYGLEKQNRLSPSTAKLINGAREVVFEFADWRIRCALLPAIDGNSYIVREEYSKIWNAAVMKAGGSFLVRDFERDAVLTAEGGQWTVTTANDLGGALPSSADSSFLRAFAMNKIWKRQDGAIVLTNLGNTSLLLNLPQAFKYEAAAQGITDEQSHRKAKQSIQPAAPPLSIVPKAIATTSPIRIQQMSAPSPLTAPAAVLSIAAHGHAGAYNLVSLAFVGLAGGSIFLLKLLKQQKGSRSPASRSPEAQPANPPPLPVSASKARTVNDLDWEDFELLVGEIYRRQGFKAELSAGLGADGGIDLILHRGNERVLVQCKSWNVYKVSAPAIREFYGVLVSEKADRGIFVTTGVFTRDAKEFAKGKPVEMIDGEALEKLLEQSKSDSDDDVLNVRLWAPAFLAASIVTHPNCPFCKTPMVRRNGRNGVFWGCSGYARCRGKRDMRTYL